VDRLDEAVPVARAVGQQHQDDGAYVSLAGSAGSAMAATRTEEPAGTTGAAPTPAGFAESGTAGETGTVREVGIVIVIVKVIAIVSSIHNRHSTSVSDISQ
jgi:hypothetical protein